SSRIPTSVHTLSRVINEGYNQTFSQFINEKRVKEFINQIEQGKEYDSFLSLAFSAGFNSKATFNRSFKKYTGTTPRLYFTT
ncbi:MAG: AraC family transcriptional regulator, partial [Cyclobacteriaceae bacterium]